MRNKYIDMKIIEVLKRRSEKAEEPVKLELKLYTLADDLEKKSRAHLKRIITILSEFDVHDEKHSEKVVFNIERLLGDHVIESLSCYELFLLHMSAFLHDCAMAPSDWELNAMRLTEGNEYYFSDESSIKNDLKPPLKITAALKLVSKRKDQIYRQFEGDVKGWMFSPKTEAELNDYLANLLIDYQNYRNGFADQIKKLKNQKEFEALNEFIRIDYIRATHHTRIETYIKNLEPDFGKAFEQPAWGKKLAHDLSLVCRSHGEDANFINNFNTNAQYYGCESANLQFVALMLRLGDIIHFSYDRAPIDLRSSRLFKSEYSFQQWAIKNNGVNYTIDNGRISFRAYCEMPETYFKLHNYIDWIETEIQHYFKFQRQWNKIYIENLQDKVDRTNIGNDTANFLPRRGLSFSLNQKKIIELLMGVGLYKDKFACLRELYQNALDACRCMLSYHHESNLSPKGLITFSIQKDAENCYLCCVDNGIGMTKEIIENYLLKIGNSYYKSSDFFKQQAKWGGQFTPTSQFGIGILSCFMIGDKIEITTKVSSDDYISCSIDGPHENFYYKKTTAREVEIIPVSGTIVKVLLNEEIKKTLHNTVIEKLGLLLLGIHDRLPEKFVGYTNLLSKWENNIYPKVNGFIQVIPNDIEVRIELDDFSVEKILPKPVLIDSEYQNLDIEEKDFEFIDYLNNYGRFYSLKEKFREIKDYIENYRVKLWHNSIEYITILTLPKKEFSFNSVNSLYATPQIGGYGICIDGISINRDSIIGMGNYYSGELSRSGLLNFTGELRPQLSVDRSSIVNYPKECEVEAEVLTMLLIKEILDVTKKHIEKYGIKEDSKEFGLIWEYVFGKIGFADTLFINELSLTEYGEINWKGLENLFGEKISIRAFLESSNITVNDFNLAKLDILTNKLVLTKLISSKKISVSDNTVSVETERISRNNLIEKRRRSFSEYHLLISADEWNISHAEYDIVSNLYPLIPIRLFNLLDKAHTQSANDRIKIVHSFSNGITAFFNQSPLLINEGLGLYAEEKDAFGGKKDLIYNFERKRSNFALSELNERGFRSKEVYVLVVYIASEKLTNDEEKKLQKIEDSDGRYVKGVKEGWSLLITSMDEENVVVLPGKSSRNELVSKLSHSFWEKYKDFTFKFTDGELMRNPT